MRIKTVARRPWSVSCTTGSHIKGAILSVIRFPWGLTGKIVHGEGYGRVFPSKEAAWQWALEHGYLQAYVTPWCRKCRVAHTFLGRRSGWCDVHNEFVFGQE